MANYRGDASVAIFRSSRSLVRLRRFDLANALGQCGITTLAQSVSEVELRCYPLSVPSSAIVNDVIVQSVRSVVGLARQKQNLSMARK